MINDPAEAIKDQIQGLIALAKASGNSRMVKMYTDYYNRVTPSGDIDEETP